MPIAASRASRTLEGKKLDSHPSLATPKAICSRPAMVTAIKNVSNEFIMPMSDASVNVRPADGPEMLVGEPLSEPTTKPPIIPAIIPAVGGAPEIEAMPMPIGMATQATTKAAANSVSMPVVSGSSASGRNELSNAAMSFASCI